jgi:SAM-dependent methyltransferase
MPGHPPEVLRSTFDEVPELYERARPGYPSEIFDDLGALAELPTGARIAEIGCGTGQATVPLAQRGYVITCVELGARLAAVARRRLADFPNVRVLTTSFESWSPESPGFDAVVAFSSFHWVPAHLRYRKSADVLRKGGKLAVVSTAHVLPPDGDPFFNEVREDYQSVVPDEPTMQAGVTGPPHPDEVGALSDKVLAAEFQTSGCFNQVGARRYLWDLTYTADEYIDLLNTYSGYRALDEELRTRLFARIHRRIEARPQRNVRWTGLALLYVAERT